MIHYTVQLIFNCHSMYFYDFLKDFWHHLFVNCSFNLQISLYIAVHGREKSNRISEWATSAFHRFTHTFQNKSKNCHVYYVLLPQSWYITLSHSIYCKSFQQIRLEQKAVSHRGIILEHQSKGRRKERSRMHRMKNFNVSCEWWSKFLFLCLDLRVPSK